MEAKNIAKEISRNSDNRSKLQAQAIAMKKDIETLKKRYDSNQVQLHNFCLDLPNIPSATTPDGKDADNNVEVRCWGEKPQFSFSPRDHLDIATDLALMDNVTAAKLSGARFTVLYGQLAELQRALTRWMLDVHTTQHAYYEVYVPYLISTQALTGTGQLPKFADDLFHITNTDLYLIPTSEVPLTNLYREQIMPVSQLPLRLVAHTPCFRSEAGSYGKDTRGIIRQHQFEKVELVQLVEPSQSAAALEEITSHAEAILQGLRLPYRVLSLCSGDLGFASTQTYDLELWLPSQNKYVEVSSCSNMSDFQARRMQLRMSNGKKTELVHTLNGSGLAVGRTLAGVLENYQLEDGRVRVPDILIPYMRKDILEANPS